MIEPTARPRILALDLSLTCTGYCLDGETGRIASRQKGWERVDEIRKAIGALLIGVNVTVIEGYSFASTGRSVFQIAGLGEIIRYTLWRTGRPYVDVPPPTLKKYATGKGNSPKDAMIEAAIRHFGFRGSGNDEADAYLLWAMAMHAYGRPVARITKRQQEAVAVVEWK